MGRSVKPTRTTWKTRSNRLRTQRKTWIRPERKCRRLRSGANHRETILFSFTEKFSRLDGTSRRRPRFSAHFHAPWMPWAATAISGGVIPLRESFAHAAATPGYRVRAAVRYFARGANPGDRSHRGNLAGAN